MQFVDMASWKLHQNSVYVFHSRPSADIPTGAVRVIGLDMDDTLLCPLSGLRFPRDANDWKWWHACVPQRLVEEVNSHPHARIVVFTNQRGVSKGTRNVEELKTKIAAWTAQLPVAVTLLMATCDDQYRKPSVGMWSLLEQELSEQGCTIDHTNSLYVGDAAGRIAGWDGNPRRKKDFSASDRKFAANVGVRFQTPEEFFLRASPCTAAQLVPDWPPAVQAVINQLGETISIANQQPDPVYADTSRQELVILVAPPASGKTTFAQTYFVQPHGYVHVNQDTLKTKERCVRTVKEQLAAGRSVIVDNTNPSAETRALYVACGAAHNIPVRCIILDTDLELAKHLSYYRERTTNGARKHISTIAFNTFRKNFVVPDAGREGFACPVVHVPFVPRFSAEEQRIFVQHS